MKIPESENRYGHFSTDNKEYLITNPNTPRHWYNYLWNDHYVSLFSQVGQGESFCQDEIGNRIPVVSARMAFLIDQNSGDFRNLNGIGTHEEFRCTHGLGYSVIQTRCDKICTSFRIFVPEDIRGEIWSLRITNHDIRGRTLLLVPFIDTLIEGPQRPQAYYLANGSFDPRQQAAIIHKYTPFAGCSECYNFMVASHPVTGYETNERTFIGYGTWQHPDAVIRGSLSNSDCEAEKPVLALGIPFTLAPGAETEIHVVTGTALSINEIAEIKARLFQPNAVAAALQRVQTTITAELTGVTFTAPMPHLNQFSSFWLKRQISLGTRWARVRHNGFRDLTQDIGALACWNPSTAFERFKRVLGFQYSSGYAPRTWLDGKILDKGFSDNHVWIPFTAYNLILETGDPSLLNTEIPFNDGTSASFYEHIKRAIDYLWNDRGMFGLCRMHHGDWNDCLNNVGPGGKGVSVWLSQAWLLANQQFGELARLRGELNDVEIASQRGEEMRAAINQHGWDGEYYLRAYTDTGLPIGSCRNEQGTFYLNPQAWAVISGAADQKRAHQILDLAEQFLETDLGTTGVLNPYSYPQANIGSMSQKKPGVQENGGVYLHSFAFKLVADCILKRRQQVERDLKKMLAFADPSSRINDGEPYVFSNCYFTIENSYRYGTCGQSWGTGSAGWFFMALLNHVFGLKPEVCGLKPEDGGLKPGDGGLRIDPCLPPSWKRCTVTRHFRNAVYQVTYHQTGTEGIVDEIKVNGSQLAGSLLPWATGKTFDVTVIIK